MYKMYLEVKKNMVTKKNLVNLAVLLIAGTALLNVVCFAGEECTAESTKVQGLVSVTKDVDGSITAVTLTTAEGAVYNVMLDENGTKLGTEMADKNVVVEGAVAEQDGQKTITVISYAAEQA
jgi:hypothetical protein